MSIPVDQLLIDALQQWLTGNHCTVHRFSKLSGIDKHLLESYLKAEVEFVSEDIWVKLSPYIGVCYRHSLRDAIDKARLEASHKNGHNSSNNGDG